LYLLWQIDAAAAKTYGDDQGPAVRTRYQSGFAALLALIKKATRNYLNMPCAEVGEGGFQM
jgi:hypothetical protein